MNFSQILFGYFSLKIYGVFLALAFILGSTLYYNILKKENFSLDIFLHFYWRWILVGFGSARLLAFILQAPELIERNGALAPFAFWDGGFHFLGFLFGFLSLMIFDLKKKKIDGLRWIDRLIPPFLIAFLCLDIGGFLTGQVYGTETSLWWGVQYETFSVDILNPIHPITLYAFIFHSWLLVWTYKYKNIYATKPGKLAIRFGLLFFAFEFFLEFLKGNPDIILFWNFRMNHFFLFLILSFLFAFGHYRRKKPAPVKPS